MIAKFNRIQLLKAVFAAVVSLLATVITFLVVKYAFVWTVEQFGTEGLKTYGSLFALVLLAGAWVTGWSFWRRQLNDGDLLEVGLLEGMEETTRVGYALNRETDEIRGCTFLLTKFALVSPLQAFKAFDLMRSRIPNQAELESNLEQLVADISSKGKWHDISEYSGREREVMYLVRMRKVDFSARRGTLRIAE